MYLHKVYHLYNSGVQLPAVDSYAFYLKSVYTREKLPIYDKWPRVKSKKYINLALIEKEDITRPEADQFTRATIHGNIDDIKKSKQATRGVARSSPMLGHSMSATPPKKSVPPDHP